MRRTRRLTRRATPSRHAAGPERVRSLSGRRAGTRTGACPRPGLGGAPRGRAGRVGRAPRLRPHTDDTQAAEATRLQAASRSAPSGPPNPHRALSPCTGAAGTARAQLTSPKPPFPRTLYCLNVFFVTGCLRNKKKVSGLTYIVTLEQRSPPARPRLLCATPWPPGPGLPLCWVRGSPGGTGWQAPPSTLRSPTGRSGSRPSVPRCPPWAFRTRCGGKGRSYSLRPLKGSSRETADPPNTHETGPRRWPFGSHCPKDSPRAAGPSEPAAHGGGRLSRPHALLGAPGRPAVWTRSGSLLGTRPRASHGQAPA